MRLHQIVGVRVISFDHSGAWPELFVRRRRKGQRTKRRAGERKRSRAQQPAFTLHLLFAVVRNGQMRDSRRALFFHRRWAQPRFGVNSAPAILFGPGAGYLLSRNIGADNGRKCGESVLPISCRRCASFKELFGLSVLSARSDSRPANTRLQATGLRAARPAPEPPR